MALISGPFNTDTHNGDYSEALRQQKYSCFPRKAVNLPYQVGRTHMRGSTGYWNYVMLVGSASSAAVHCAELKARTYDKFYGKAIKRANLGVTLAQFPLALSMISNRAKQLSQALRYLKRGNLKLVVSTLGIDDHPATRSATRRAQKAIGVPSAAWLEYTFGWTPLVQDIFSAVDVLKQDFDFARLKANVNFVEYVAQSWDGGSWYSFQHFGKYYMGGSIKVTNPNTLIAKSLGLTNPATVLWDVVPFSFVIDWFIPVNKFLQSLDNDFGIEIEDAYHGWALKSIGSCGHIAHDLGGTCSGVHVSGERVIGVIPRPSLFDRFRSIRIDPWLASTSLALLSQQWNRMR